MDINTIQGSNAYSAPKSTPVPVDDTLLRNQNREAARADLSQESTRAIQEAFDVRITQEARDRQAAEKTSQTPLQAEGPERGTRPDPGTLQASNARQIIDFVA